MKNMAIFRKLCRPLTLLLLTSTLFVMSNVAQAACTTQGCVMAGPRLVNLTTAQGTLLGPLLGGLLGTNLNVTALDWQQIAGSDVDIAKMLNLLQSQLSVSTPAQALNTNASLAQILGAAAGATVGSNAAGAQVALANLAANPSIPLSNIRLGDLIAIGSTPTNTTINALDLVTGAVQLYNLKNVATTPAPVGIDLTKFPLLTGLSALTIQAQVVEPAVYVCGPAGTQFHTAAIRLKLNLTLLPNTINGGISLLGLNITGSTVALVPNLSVFVEVARADGTISSLNAIGGALQAQVAPGVADLYIGTMADTLFFQRTHTITYADVAAAKIADVSITLLGGLLKLTADATIRSQAHGATNVGSMSFGPTYPQTLTVSSGGNFVTNLVTTLLNNLQVGLVVSLNTAGVDLTALASALTTLLGSTLSPIISPVISTVVDPLLELIGLKLGQAIVTGYGVYNVCPVSGIAYNDANHTALHEYAELGTGLTLYAKLVSPSSPTTVYQTAVVNTTTGSFTFSSVIAASYTLLIDTSNTISDVSATVPTGWIPTEVPTLTRSFTMTTSDITNQTFGLYNGSSFTGRVFNDDGIGGGTANNVIREGGETSLPGIIVKVTDNAGTTTYDTATTADDGAYLLWIPAVAGATTLKVTEANASTYVSVGATVGNTSGTYTLASDTVNFTNVIGTVYTGIDFADVPANQFDTDGRQSILPGNVAFYPHVFTAGTAGTLTLAGSAPAVNGWSHLLYRDVNCNGAIDTATDTVIALPIAVVATDKVCVVVRVFVSGTAAIDEQYPLTLSASFAYANNSLTGSHSRSDLTVAGGSGDAGLKLTKVVDHATAMSGDVLTYTITYINNSPSVLTALKVNDFTPAYTTFTSAACGTLPTGITGCSLSVQPTAGVAGAVEWAFVGQLAAGASGTVTLRVTLQ